MIQLFCFGFGYVARHLAQKVLAAGGVVAGTKRLAMDMPPQNGHTLFAYEAGRGLSPQGLKALSQATHVLLSIPPEVTGDPALHDYQTLLAQLPALTWVGLLSTTGVYGDTDGAWVDETAPLNPLSPRDKTRVTAEQQLRATSLPAHVFRLAGIYGPPGEGRSPLDRAASGAKPIHKPDHVFNRIHVADIVQILMASMKAPTPGEIYNLADDLPAAGDEVLQYAYQVLGQSSPDTVPFDQAELSAMGREFYAGCKRVRNNKVKEKLGVTLLYPTYREGLA
jgi:hypothetical protein